MSLEVTLVLPYTEKPYGGARVVAYNLLRGFIRICKELERKDIKITVISYAGRKLKPLEQFSQCPQLKIMSYRQIKPATFLGELQHIYLAKKYFSRILSSASIIHSHNVTFSLPMAKMFKNKILIHNFHGLYWNEKKYSSIYFKLSHDTLTFRSRKLANLKNVKFVAISHFVAEEIQRFLGVPNSNIHIIYDPVSEDFFDIKKRELPGLIFYPARLIPRKNHLALINALGILKKEGFNSFTLVLTGAVEDKGYFNKIMKLVKKHELKKNIAFLGNVSREKLFEYYSKASVVVLTSLEESFSLAVAEAMATGTPVVASPVGIVPEAIEHGKNGLIIDPLTPKDIAEKIRIVLEDNKKRRIMGKRAKVAAEQWKGENIAINLINLYFSILNHL